MSIERPYEIVWSRSFFCMVHSAINNSGSSSVEPKKNQNPSCWLQNAPCKNRAPSNYFTRSLNRHQYLSINIDSTASWKKIRRILYARCILRSIFTLLKGFQEKIEYFFFTHRTVHSHASGSRRPTLGCKKTPLKNYFWYLKSLNMCQKNSEVKIYFSINWPGLWKLLKFPTEKVLFPFNRLGPAPKMRWLKILKKNQGRYFFFFFFYIFWVFSTSIESTIDYNFLNIGWHRPLWYD